MADVAEEVLEQYVEPPVVESLMELTGNRDMASCDWYVAL